MNKSNHNGRWKSIQKFICFCHLMNKRKRRFYSPYLFYSALLLYVIKTRHNSAFFLCTLVNFLTKWDVFLRYVASIYTRILSVRVVKSSSLHKSAACRYCNLSWINTKFVAVHGSSYEAENAGYCCKSILEKINKACSAYTRRTAKDRIKTSAQLMLVRTSLRIAELLSAKHWDGFY
jgi:hypothetical protein